MSSKNYNSEITLLTTAASDHDHNKSSQLLLTKSSSTATIISNDSRQYGIGKPCSGDDDQSFELHRYYSNYNSNKSNTSKSSNSNNSSSGISGAAEAAAAAATPTTTATINNVDNFFSKNLILAELWGGNKTSSVIYENLCTGCGYGVFEAKGKLCNFCQFIVNGYFQEDEVEDNIYENICVKCGEIFSGKECDICNQYNSSSNNNSQNLVKKRNKKIKKTTRILSGIFETLKRVKTRDKNTATTNSVPSSSSSSETTKSRKLEIVHNVDGFNNVFKTKETFDLNRICELKRQQSNSDNHIYGKLRKSDDHLMTTSFETSHHNRSLVANNSRSDPTLHKIIKFTTSAQHLNRTNSITVNRGRKTNKWCQQDHISYDNVKKAHTFYQDNSVIEWMTSLRSQTFDYNTCISGVATDDSICNPKSIPSRNFSCCGFVHEFGNIVGRAGGIRGVGVGRGVVEFLSTTTTTRTSSSSAGEEDSLNSLFINDQDCTIMVDEFKRNLMEKQRSKRRAIYLKIDDDLPSNLMTTTAVATPTTVVATPTTAVATPTTTTRRTKNPAVISDTIASDSASIAAFDSLCGTFRRSRRRYGFYEKNSDFVNDLLNAFDAVLSRDRDNNHNNGKDQQHDVVHCDLNNSTEVIPDSVIRISAGTEHQTLVSSPSSSSSSLVVQEPVPVISNCGGIYSRLDLNESRHLNESCTSISSSTNNGDHEVALAKQIIINLDLYRIIALLAISKSLNRVVITYDKHLSEFLTIINTHKTFSSYEYSRLFKIFLKISTILNLKQQKVRNNNKQDKIISNKSDRAIAYLQDHHQNYHYPLRYQEIISNKSESMTIQTPPYKEEDIYQPIWKFKTVGNPRESYASDSYYYDTTTPTYDSSRVEDHGEWETDDEFMFSTKMKEITNDDNDAKNAASIKKINSATNISNTSIISSTSAYSGSSSTINSMIKSTNEDQLNENSLCMTSNHYRSSKSSNDPYQNVCIFYSLQEPKLRAIVYNCDQRSKYFSSQNKSNEKNDGCDVKGRSPEPLSLSSSSSPSLSLHVPFKLTTTSKIRKSSPKYFRESVRSSPISDSVQAWKFMLLSVNYLEDEEDVYISEDEILKLKHIEVEPMPGTATLQRFKSVSSDNLLDIPQDKKSIGERFRNKLQRGVLKLNSRQSKDKKGKPFFKRSDSTSLYLEDGIKPKYPIFGAHLNEVEMDSIECTVPRFIVDCISFIEQKESIQIDGLYRASGNKVAIDELKKKLTESYIYDSRLLRNEDVHTITGILKLFFRELETPLIPQDIYKKLPENLVESSNLPTIKRILLEIPKLSLGTLKFLLKHLTLVAHYSGENRMPASNLAIIWGPCILHSSMGPFEIARMNTLAKVLIENYDAIFGDNERLVN